MFMGGFLRPSRRVDQDLTAAARPAMTGINSDAFFWPSLSRDGPAFQAENDMALGLPGHLRGAKPRIALVAVDAVDLLQPLSHRLLEVVAGLAVLRVAAGDEFILLLL